MAMNYRGPRASFMVRTKEGKESGFQVKMEQQLKRIFMTSLAELLNDERSDTIIRHSMEEST